jgi:phage tail P2-like protein
MTLLPNSAQSDRTLAFDQVMARLQAIDLSVLNIYDIDNVNESALFDLADQFNVLGLRGWALARTTAARRSLIKEAIQLHQKAGTPYAVRRSLALVGYPNATIEENPGNYYDGTLQYTGDVNTNGFQYNGSQLGAFIVTLDETQSEVSGDLITLIVALINEWKNARSWLLDLRIGTVSLFSNLLQYDGQWLYDNSQEYDGERNI